MYVLWFFTEKWFFTENIHKPYAQKQTLELLADQTKLNKTQIDMWLRRQRCINKRTNKEENTKKSDRNILQHYFDNISNKPSIYQIAELQKETNFSEKQIYRWFANERHKHINNKVKQKE